MHLRPSQKIMFPMRPKKPYASTNNPFLQTAVVINLARRNPTKVLQKWLWLLRKSSVIVFFPISDCRTFDARNPTADANNEKVIQIESYRKKVFRSPWNKNKRECLLTKFNTICNFWLLLHVRFSLQNKRIEVNGIRRPSARKKLSSDTLIKWIFVKK